MKKMMSMMCAAAALMTNVPAHAASLIGKTLTVQYITPNFDWIESSFIHVAGMSDDMMFGDSASGHFTENSFVVDALAAVNFLSSDFTGIRIFDHDNVLGAFTNVALSGLSTHPYIATFDPGRITFDADNIYINLQGSGIRRDRNLIFDIEMADNVVANAIPNAVPEPAAWIMMLAGFGAIGGVLRRRSAEVRTAAA